MTSRILSPIFSDSYLTLLKITSRNFLMSLKRRLIEEETSELQLYGDLNSKTEKELDSIARSLNYKLTQHDLTKHLENTIRLQNNEQT